MAKKKDKINPLFICRNCGNIMYAMIEDVEKDSLSSVNECSICHNSLNWENQFPSLNAYDFINTARDLFDAAKKRDKENLEKQYNHISESTGKKIDKTLLGGFIREYENIREKYTDNDDCYWNKILDDFDKFLYAERSEKELDIDIFAVEAAVSTFRKNPFRKPFIIIVASLIEHMFNDYFSAVIEVILPPNGRKVFLAKYDYAGIQSALEIIDSFSDEKLRDKMDKHSRGFYDKWDTLRKLRNDIIHSNNKYITKNKVAQINKLIEESFLVFSKLKSELYSD